MASLKRLAITSCRIDLKINSVSLLLRDHMISRLAFIMRVSMTYSTRNIYFMMYHLTPEIVIHKLLFSVFSGGGFSFGVLDSNRFFHLSIEVVEWQNLPNLGT